VSVFFDGTAPRLDERLVTGYATADEYVVDLLGLAAHWIDRAVAFARMYGVAPAGMSTVDETLTAAGARIAEATRWIDARIAASMTPLPITELVLRFGLDTTDLHVIGLLVAVELDATLLLRFGPTPPPGIDAAALHAAIDGGRTGRAEWTRMHLGTDAPLVAGGLVRFEELVGIPLSRRPLVVARPVLHRITGVAPGDELLAGIVTAVVDQVEHPQAAELAPLMRAGGTGIALWIYGGGARLELAVAVAQADRRSATIVDASALGREVGARQRAAAAAMLALEQRLDDRVVIVRVDDGDDADALRTARLLVARLPGPCILVSVAEHIALAALASGSHRYAFPRLGPEQRHVEWERQLASYSIALPESALAQLATDFPLDASDIEEVVRSVARGTADITIERLRANALARQRSRLGRLTQFVPHGFAIEELVLPDEELNRLREIVARQHYRELVFGDWNMASRVPYGTGTAAMFAGPPGTGKTMAASVIARMLGRELYRIDLSRVVDKYIGETEKNLGAIFDAAVDANAILLFDEADSLFAKRTTVSSSHDRYANLETNYLLQRIEEHPGLSILTTNNAQSIDPAFSRRLQFRVEFPFPDADARAEIWQRCFAPEVPRARDLDFRTLGEAFELSGANIKSAVLRAAFAAAQLDGPVTTMMLADAAAREFENAGKLPPAFTRRR
jgi:hypothetical protein